MRCLLILASLLMLGCSGEPASEAKEEASENDGGVIGRDYKKSMEKAEDVQKVLDEAAEEQKKAIDEATE